SIRPTTRAEAMEQYKPTLTLKGNAANGATLFSRTCATCHAFREQGFAVGPDLAALNDRSTQALFIAILDPNAAVDRKFAYYTLHLKDVRNLSGIIAEETGPSLTILQANAVRETVLRSEIKSLKSSSLSMMPEGLEQGMTPQDLADLIRFVQGG